MRESPYREPGPIPRRPAFGWSGRRARIVNVVIAAVVVGVFLHLSGKTLLLTLAEPMSPQPFAPFRDVRPLEPLRPTGLESLTGDEMESVMRMHSMDAKRICWTSVTGGGASSAAETIHVTIDGTGHVAKAWAQGTNEPVGTCLAREISGWVFPATGVTTGPVDFPFKFVRQ